MEGIRSSFAALEKAVKADAKKCATLEKDLMQLSSISRLLSLSEVPPSTKTRLSNLFRKTLCLFYPDFLSHALMYALSLVQHIHEDKIQSSLQSSDAADASQWQGLQAAIISGILDFIEDSEQPSSKVQITIADKVFPKLCPLYVEKGASRPLWTLDRGLAVTICQLLNAITMGNGVTANQLRQRVGRYLGLIIYITSDPTDMTSSQIGEMISKVKDFLVLEAVLMLFGYLTPPLKKGRESRTTFIKEVFNLSTFPAHDRIVSLADSSAPDKWDSTLTKIVAILAESDLSSPQPFDVKKINISNTLMTLEPPFYVDKKGFSGNYELADGNIDLLEIPFVALKAVRCNVERSNAAISLELSRSIDVGGRRVEIESTSDANAALSFVVPVTRLSYFMQALKHRHVSVRLGQPRFSTAGKEINLDIPLVRDDSKAFSQRRIEQFAQAHLETSTSPSLNHVGSQHSAIEISSSPAFNPPAQSPKPKPKPAPSAPASPLTVISDDDEPIKPRAKCTSKKGYAFISEDEESDMLPQQVWKDDPARDNGDTSKGRTTRSAAAKTKPPAAASKADAPLKRKRVIDSEDESDTGGRPSFEEKKTASPPAKKAYLKTYKKKAKTAPTDPSSPPGVNFDELPKSKKLPPKKVTVKPKTLAKAEKGQCAAKREPPKPRPINKKDDKKVKAPVKEVKPIDDVSHDIVEEGRTLAEASDVMPSRPTNTTAKSTVEHPSSPRKIAKPKKAPWEDMDIFCPRSEDIVPEKIMEFSPLRRLDVDPLSYDDSDHTKLSMLGDKYIDFTVPLQQVGSSTDTDANMGDTTVVDPEQTSSPKMALFQSSPAPKQQLYVEPTEVSLKPPVLRDTSIERDYGNTKTVDRPRSSKPDKPERRPPTGRQESLTDRTNLHRDVDPLPPSPVQIRRPAEPIIPAPVNVPSHILRPQPMSVSKEHEKGSGRVEQSRISYADQSEYTVQKGKTTRFMEHQNIREATNESPISRPPTKYAFEATTRSLSPVNVPIPPQITRSKPCGRTVADDADEYNAYFINRGTTSAGPSNNHELPSRIGHGLGSPTNSHPGRKHDHHRLRARDCDDDEFERPYIKPTHRNLKEQSNMKTVVNAFKRRELEVERGAHDSPHKLYRKAREAPQKPVPDPMDKIVEVLREVNEAVIDKIQNNFQSVTTNLQISQQASVMRVVDLLVKMQSERGEIFNELLEGAKATKEQINSILKDRDQAHLASVHCLKAYKEIIEDHDRRTLSKKLPPKLIPKPPPTVAKFLKS